MKMINFLPPKKYAHNALASGVLVQLEVILGNQVNLGVHSYMEEEGKATCGLGWGGGGGRRIEE